VEDLVKVEMVAALKEKADHMALDLVDILELLASQRTVDN
jgi:hypothetical protein